MNLVKNLHFQSLPHSGLSLLGKMVGTVWNRKEYVSVKRSKREGFEVWRTEV